MGYQISDAEMEEISVFVPGWFVQAVLAGESEDSIKDKLKEELAAAHKIAGRKISPFELKEKVEDLHETYMDTLSEYQTEEKGHGTV